MTSGQTMEPLPLKCEASYLAHFLSDREAEDLFEDLCANFDLNDRVIQMGDGSEFIAHTGSFLFADEELIRTDAFLPVWGKRAAFPEALLRVKERIEQLTEARFQVARCIYYEDGREGMSFHSDPPAYGPTDQIASLSLGAEREFHLREIARNDEVFKVTLRSGSLFYMGPRCQDLYEHAIPEDLECHRPRINLTFRKFEAAPGFAR